MIDELLLAVDEAEERTQRCEGGLADVVAGELVGFEESDFKSLTDLLLAKMEQQSNEHAATPGWDDSEVERYVKEGLEHKWH